MTGRKTHSKDKAGAGGPWYIFTKGAEKAIREPTKSKGKEQRVGRNIKQTSHMSKREVSPAENP